MVVKDPALPSEERVKALRAMDDRFFDLRFEQDQALATAREAPSILEQELMKHYKDNRQSPQTLDRVRDLFHQSL